MGDVTKIQWTDHTQNFWIGCTEVSPGCDRCYARELSGRYGFATWGPGEPRHRTGAGVWKRPFTWDRKAGLAGERRRVFCMSLGDLFDTEVPREWRDDAFDVIGATPNLDWQLLTKRPVIAGADLRRRWDFDPWPNVWLGTSVENGAMASLRIPVLQGIPAAIRFLSVEPLLEAVSLTPASLDGIDWVIVGGESGAEARPMELDWARRVVEDCRAAGVAVFVKQLGASLSASRKLRDRKGGDILEWPEELRVRQWPSSGLKATENI